VAYNDLIHDWSKWSTTSTVTATQQWHDGNSFVHERIGNFHISESSLKQMAKNIADEIDTEVMNDLLRQANHKNTAHFKAVKFNPENLWSEPND
jgi:hypothetical protein